ncbi:hypothetical protein MNR01_08315 [Lysobacter sp. S4-A87]|uniref:hypothetical protein n=1 Tax=Lysobacter sp. S4-A87 TaxID=2925843 RepID=UPI001F538F6E|nr:hypothetical protein [Lysobacter sp. S4-A87]UNK50984.1 hypothetical protein MNR01_08315 [Lysobacter sp. S4-A87]
MTRTLRLATTTIAALLLLSACSSWPFGSDTPPVSGGHPRQPADEFFSNLQALCGKAFAGRIVIDEPPTPGAPFTGKALIMHVRQCERDRIAIPFHVGDDHSRTLLLTRTKSGLTLDHDRRHRDGSQDVLSMYGGATVDRGSATRQVFPVDAHSMALFERNERSDSVTNVWTLEIEPGRIAAYERSRPGRRFRIEFDLTRPVPAPPAPWGW